MISTFHGIFAQYQGSVLPSWSEMAEDKGFRIAARLIDKNHLALECRLCGGLNKVKVFTLRSVRPICHGCLEARRRNTANKAGVRYLGPCPQSASYGIYRMDCGHEVRRQFELIDRVAQQKTGLRCGICHTSKEAAEAAANGWTLIGPDPEGNMNYREYEHSGCGHRQRVARANMQTGRFCCEACSEGWSADPSYLYLISFTLTSGQAVVKLGFSRNPESRMLHQLRVDPQMPCELLAKIPVATGRAALIAEKRLHREIKQRYPDMVIDEGLWQNELKVKSEVYDSRLSAILLQMLHAPGLEVRLEELSDLVS